MRSIPHAFAMISRAGTFLLAACILTAAVASTCAADAPAPLRWAADKDGGAPYVFMNPKKLDETIGFEVDLAAALSKELGREIKFGQYAYVNLLPGLKRNDFDLAMNGLEATPERAKDFRLSRPYYIYKLQLVCREDDDRFKSIDDCQKKGAVVGTLGETAAERLLDDKNIKKKLYDGQVEPYMDLELGRIDAVLLDVPIAVYCAKDNKKLKFVGDPIAEGQYVIVLRKEDEKLAAQVDAAIAHLAEQGELKRIYTKWGIWNDDQQRLTPTASPSEMLGRKDATFSGYFPLLLEAAVTTIEISMLSMAVAIVLGLLIAVMRLYGAAPLRWLAVGYIEFFRGIPVLLLLVFIYYGVPNLAEYYHLGVSLKLDGFTAAVVTFGINYAAYEAEIYRAGINAVPHGQWEAAASLGMRSTTAFGRIILPQAVRTILPPMTNDFVSLFKDTSLASVIAVVELTQQYQFLTRTSMKYLEIGAVTCTLYLAMSVPLGYLSLFLERRWSKGMH